MDPSRGTFSGAKKTNANDDGDDDNDIDESAQNEASRKRQRVGQAGRIETACPPVREMGDTADEAKSSSLSFDSAAHTNRQSPLRLPAVSYSSGPPSLFLREQEQLDQSNRLLNARIQYPTNDQIASLLRGPMQFPAVNHQRLATSQLLNNLTRSELNVASLLARQSGLAGLSSGGMSASMVHPLLQSRQRQDTTQQQLDRLSSLSRYGGGAFGAVGAGRFRMAAGGLVGPQVSLSRFALSNPQQAAIAGQNISLPQDEGASQITLPFAQNTSLSSRARAIESGTSAGTASPRPLQLPPIDEGLTLHHSQRIFVPLGIEEDNNWLSELHCLVRLDLVEIFRAGRQEVAARSANKRISYLQVGVRCRFCAHLPTNLRAARSSAFPSSIRQIYQSFTMMLRDHFGQCSAMPDHHKAKFLELKTSASQGASHSKLYWNYSAMRVGLVDTDSGIVVTERTQAAGKLEPPFGSKSGQVTVSSQTSLVLPEDRALVNDFMYTLMSQAHMVHLLPSEQIGNRKSLRKEMPGFGCRFCCRVGWLGLSRMFPARRRTLRSKANDLYTHLKRCSLCPQEVKTLLESLDSQRAEGDAEGEKLFFDQIWARLGQPGEC